jgi:hypothetical protein
MEGTGGYGIVTYKTTGVPESGFNHDATFERGDISSTNRKQSTSQLTRKEIEKLFADFVAGKSGAAKVDKK